MDRKDIINSIESKELFPVLVYGSLREGEYNSTWLSSTSFFGKLMTLPKYKLYSFGPYPGIKESNNTKDTVVFQELFLDAYNKKDIDNMEISAGYQIKKETINDITYDLYVFKYSVEDYELVQHGDWSKYVQEKIGNYAKI